MLAIMRYSRRSGSRLPNLVGSLCSCCSVKKSQSGAKIAFNLSSQSNMVVNSVSFNIDATLLETLETVLLVRDTARSTGGDGGRLTARLGAALRVPHILQYFPPVPGAPQTPHGEGPGSGETEESLNSIGRGSLNGREQIEHHVLADGLPQQTRMVIGASPHTAHVPAAWTPRQHEYCATMRLVLGA